MSSEARPAHLYPSFAHLPLVSPLSYTHSGGPAAAACLSLLLSAFICCPFGPPRQAHTAPLTVGGAPLRPP